MCKSDFSNLKIRPGLPARIGIGLIWIYQHSLSLLIGRACRYQPTCSQYTAEAMARFGFWRGGWIGLARILRCNPLGACGYDPVPDQLPKHARWYMPWRYGFWTGSHIDPKTRFDQSD